MDNLKKLTALPGKGDLKLVAFLEDLLDAAKAGKLISLAVGGETASGASLRGHFTEHPKSNPFTLIGALAYEMHSLQHLVDELNAEAEF